MNRRIILIFIAALLLACLCACEEKSDGAPDRNYVRVWYEDNTGGGFSDYIFADFTDIWEYSDGCDSLILSNELDISYEECLTLGEEHFGELFSKMKSDAVNIGKKARAKFGYDNLKVRIHLGSSDGKLLCTVSETGARTDDDSPPVWGYK